jgi:hypothetical protein
MLRVLIIIVVIVVLISRFGTPFMGMMEGLSMDGVVAIVAVVMLAGVLREFIKRRNVFSASQKEMEEIKQHLAVIEADIADIKEQIADYIIKTN